MAYDKEGLISIVNYAEKILFYLYYETCDTWWKRLYLDKLFTNMNTLKLELYYKNKIRELKGKQQRKETEQIRNNIDTLKEEIRNKYNQQGIAVFYNLFDIYLLNESKIIKQQTDTNYIDKRIKQYPNMYKPYILKHFELNWNESDIQVLNNIIKEV
jgi:Fe-S cluster assembly scaffold protein SufB